MVHIPPPTERAAKSGGHRHRFRLRKEGRNIVIYRCEICDEADVDEKTKIYVTSRGALVAPAK